jgi:hypothetical protein
MKIVRADFEAFFRKRYETHSLNVNNTLLILQLAFSTNELAARHN